MCCNFLYVHENNKFLIKYYIIFHIPKNEKCIKHVNIRKYIYIYIYIYIYPYIYICICPYYMYDKFFLFKNVKNYILRNFKRCKNIKQILQLITNKFMKFRDKPDIPSKHCVKVAIVKPAAKPVIKRIEDKDAPFPEPAAAPHTTNTYTKEAKHSQITERQNSKVLTSTCTGNIDVFRALSRQLFLIVSNFSNNVTKCISIV